MQNGLDTRSRLQFNYLLYRQTQIMNGGYNESIREVIGDKDDLDFST